MRVAVIGARGQLGAAVVEELGRSHEVLPFDHAALDVTDGRAVLGALQRSRPAAVINCTGFNAVDAAEQQPDAALRVNAFAVRALARATTEIDSTLVHYSSDFVFDGRIERPLTEDDPPNPRSAYAISKLLGEWFATDAPRAYVLRVESLFGAAASGPPPKGTVASIIEALRSGRVVKVFSDRTVSPTFVIDAARATRELLEKKAAPGLYHCVNSGLATWLEFASEAARLLDLPAKFDVVRFADVKLPAARPQYCALSNQKLETVGIQMPEWQDALRRHIESLKKHPS